MLFQLQGKIGTVDETVPIRPNLNANLYIFRLVVFKYLEVLTKTS